MTLSLDDVRNKRFRMARKSGYEVLEVDEFVDEVEEAFAQLLEENQTLKKQVESLKGTGPAAAAVPAAGAGSQQSDRPAGTPTPIVVTTAKEASSAVIRLVEMSTEQAERLVAEATTEADRIREEASRSAEEVTTSAREKSERMQSEARTSAEELEAGATARAERLDQEIQSRRAEMFGNLERERDQLGKAILDLRRFEDAYRTNLVQHLQSQIGAVQSAHPEPSEVPELAVNLDAGPAPADAADPGQHDEDAAGASTDRAADGADTDRDSDDQHRSDTPRLDALLGDQR